MRGAPCAFKKVLFGGTEPLTFFKTYTIKRSVQRISCGPLDQVFVWVNGAKFRQLRKPIL
jgi:hypothetical protein